MSVRFWHVGISVQDLEEAIKIYENLGLKVSDRFEKDEPKLKAALMLGPDGTGVEIFQWLDLNHPQVSYIKRHTAFISDNPMETVAILKNQGCRVVIPETVGKLVDFTFLEDPNGNYIEIAKTRGNYGR